MAVWVVRAGGRGEFEEAALSGNVVGIGFGLERSILEFQDRDALLQVVEKPTTASQLWRFVHEIKIGETVVLPCKQTNLVAVGKVAGDYRYDADSYCSHLRPVQWAATDIPRPSFDQDLLYSFGGLATVFQVNRTNADERITGVVNLHLGEEGGGAPVILSDATEESSISVDLTEAIVDRIAERIRQRFTGHRLEYLVESILKSQGYTTQQTQRGADGGIDVVAGRGQMGFEEPRLCVQVKSGNTPVDLPDYNRLQGNIRGFGAGNGLLVSLSGFTRSVLNENKRSFFEIRLWGPGELTDNLLETYDRLPADIRADIPLADRKVLLESDA